MSSRHRPGRPCARHMQRAKLVPASLNGRSARAASEERKAEEEAGGGAHLAEGGAVDGSGAARAASVDSGYREELRLLLGGREVRVPAVFVRGRHVGGAAEMAKLEDEGKLRALLEGLPRARVWCAGCSGVRFVMCRDCNGSRKVLVAAERMETTKCGECNENGLVRCPICS